MEPFRREPPWRPWNVLTHRGRPTGFEMEVFFQFLCLRKAVLWKEDENNTTSMCFWGLSDQIAPPQKGNIHFNITMYSTIIWLIWHINTYYILIRVDGRNPQIYHLLSTPRGKDHIKNTSEHMKPFRSIIKQDLFTGNIPRSNIRVYQLIHRLVTAPLNFCHWKKNANLL